MRAIDFERVTQSLDGLECLTQLGVRHALDQRCTLERDINRRRARLLSIEAQCFKRGVVWESLGLARRDGLEDCRPVLFLVLAVIKCGLLHVLSPFLDDGRVIAFLSLRCGAQLKVRIQRQYDVRMDLGA